MVNKESYMTAHVFMNGKGCAMSLIDSMTGAHSLASIYHDTQIL